jgi:hypothetical protein
MSRRYDINRDRAVYRRLSKSRARQEGIFHLLCQRQHEHRQTELQGLIAENRIMAALLFRLGAAMLVLFALPLFAQPPAPPLPPGFNTNAPAVQSSTNVIVAAPVVSHLTIRWTGSISPNVVRYNVYRRNALLSTNWEWYGASTINAFLVDDTNGDFGFYYVTAVSSNGIESKLP